MKETESTMFKISEFNQAAFVEKMDKFSRRAANLNISFGYTLESEETQDYLYDLVTGIYFKTEMVNLDITRHIPVMVKWYNYSVYGDSPTINGYSFLAKIEPLEQGVNLIHTHNTEYDFSMYRTSELTCEHCNTNRYRLAYYLIKNDTDQNIKMVGRNCLANYIALPNAEKIAEFYSDILELSNDESAKPFEFRHAVPCFAIDSFLAHAVMIINKHGYTSVKNANYDKLATKDIVINNYFNTYNRENPTTSDVQQAKDIMIFIEDALSAKPVLSEYEHNILVLINARYMKISHAGYIVSIVPLFYKMSKEIQSKETTVQSSFVGSVGDKFSNVQMTCKNIYAYDSHFHRGQDYIVTLADNNDNIFIWYTSVKPCKQGDIVITKGTIKDHKEHKGIKQTIITRCKVESN